MRFERTDEGDWIVYSEPGEHGFTASESLGIITARGHIVKARGWPRGWGDRVGAALEQARHQLYQRGSLRNYDFEREVREENRTGTFVVELDDGRERRFHGFRSANAANVGTAIERPGAPVEGTGSRQPLRSGKRVGLRVPRRPLESSGL